MSVRARVAVAAGKLSSLGARRLARRGGTALPGLVAERVDPNLLARFARQLSGGTLLVTGTNGKTTTATVLAAIFEAAGRPYVHNREGSNLTRGIASALLARSDLRARLQVPPGCTGLFETDEATLPRATQLLRPRVLVFTNLFRDQLDRYGEVDSVAALWREALAAAPPEATLVLSADDPSVAELARHWQGPVSWFGIDDERLATTDTAVADARWCRCGATFAYERRYFAHVGHWYCPRCGWRRPHPDVAATGVSLTLEGTSFDLSGVGPVRLRLAGLYNVWNVLAAAAAARAVGVEPPAIAAGLAAASPAFGRQEVVALAGRTLRLFLTKNPAGANQVLRLLEGLEKPLEVAVLLNDRFADGQDPSWVWDVEYERLAPRVRRCWAAGDRAEDMALRLVYAGWPEPEAVVHSPLELLRLLQDAPSSELDLFVLATYTAMLDFRAALARAGYVQPWW